MDETQLDVVSAPVDSDILVTGPPGSGKTNLLLLRANNFYLRGQRNIAVLTFTRLLRQFIASGATEYQFPADKVQTCREWQIEFIRSFGGRVPRSSDFKEARKLFADEIERLADAHAITNSFDAILLDEAQDYTSQEIRLFRRLATRLFMVADERQQIYEVDDPFPAMEAAVHQHLPLKYHYRNGLQICKVADHIANKFNGHTPLVECSNYPEADNPSTATLLHCSSISSQANAIVERLGTQITAFPGENIGVLCPRREDVNAIWSVIVASPVGSRAVLVNESDTTVFTDEKPIIVTSFHSGKGLEFRALHLACCEALKKFPNNRKLAFTAVTRAKTALSLYHTEPIHGYLEAAINTANQAELANPTVDDLFGGRS